MRQKESIMASTTSSTPAAARRASLADPGYQAFVILRTGFTVAPILFGLDKFANLLTDWPGYLAPWLDDVVPGSAQAAMYAVGVIEIVAGVVVGLAPRFGGWLVAGWLAGIIVNLLTYSGYYDVALRDFGLLLGAVALARLAQRYHGPRVQDA
ncbi:DoxX family membrane protein [Streptomyces thermospinosisporus]|uniref:DoxX family membrane protein n=2 Tax=Streptomyces thermospinosisporus TaxID=161482 RepID=A0ABP4JJ99_9ACTN